MKKRNTTNIPLGGLEKKVNFVNITTENNQKVRNQMNHYILKRMLQLIPILFAITFLSYGMMRIAGSDVVTQKMENTGTVVSENVMDAAREQLGLDKPFLTQYFVWLGKLLRGDMGNSYVSREAGVYHIYIEASGNLTADNCVDCADAYNIDSTWCAGSSKAKYNHRLFDTVLQFYWKQPSKFFCIFDSYVFSGN